MRYRLALRDGKTLFHLDCDCTRALAEGFCTVARPGVPARDLLRAESMKKHTRKLSLHKQTLRTLSDLETPMLQHVGGAALPKSQTCKCIWSIFTCPWTPIFSDERLKVRIAPLP